VEHPDLPEARRALRLCMMHISEDYYAARWYIGLEYLLWELVSQWRADPHLEPGAEEPEFSCIYEARMLSWLAEQAGGWWRWADQGGTGTEFVPMAEWLRIYEEHQRQKTRSATSMDSTRGKPR
jgi:hypothetical protein